MKTVHHHDLRIGLLDAADLETGTPPPGTGLHMLRLEDPTREQYEQLTPQGFRLKPQWLFWSRPVYDTIDAYLATLHPRLRKSTRVAVRRLEPEHTLVVQSPVEPDSLDTWYELYRRHIARLPKGTLYAADDLADFRARPERVVALYLHHEGRMIAGLITLKVPAHRMLRAIYFGCDPSCPDPGIMRYLFLRAGEVAHELGYERLAAGADPNFYGHDVSTGLYLLKKRLGFRIDPLWRYEADDPPVLEKVVSLDRCEDPSFHLGYDGFDIQRAELVGHVLSRRPDADPAPFASPTLPTVLTQRVPA
ncbi:GNAT family N-acetyltransferase [Streptomyces paradoxus]|uniref:GNAT family N-acetyltransferase n=1 Tax=Streptomyces paradoxus TaxID=66375 RepID=UPI00382ABB70